MKIHIDEKSQQCNIFLNSFVWKPEVQAPPIPALYFVLFFCIFRLFAISWIFKDWIFPQNWMQDSVRTFACLPSVVYPDSKTVSPYFCLGKSRGLLKETMNFYMPMLFSSRPE